MPVRFPLKLEFKSASHQDVVSYRGRMCLHAASSLATHLMPPCHHFLPPTVSTLSLDTQPEAA